MQGNGKKSQWKWLLIFLAIPLVVGGISALVSRAGMKQFAAVAKPPLTPPGWLFPVAWSVLYLLMGYASYVIWRSAAGRRKIGRALLWYGAQLCANFLWSPLFFGRQLYLAALLWLGVMLVLIVVTALLFGKIERKAGWLLLPYLCWVLFAGYLNAGIWLLNR